jgi:hypothetical protein
MTTQIDFTDPCAIATALREVLHRAMLEGRVDEVEFAAGNGSSRRVRRSYASISDLKAHIAQLDNECKLKTTGRPSRFGLRAGGK